MLFFLLTTYTPKSNFILNSYLNIKKIKIENNSVIETDEIKKKLNFLYKKNLFFLNIKDIENSLKSETFIESFIIKKIYPSTLKLKIVGKKPIAILQNKKKKFFISDKGDLINFINLDIYNDLPNVFDNGENFYSFFEELQKIKFPLEMIKSFYFFESGRWDLVLYDDRVIKLPIKNYIFYLKNYLIVKDNPSLKAYKIFDYRIEDQLILN